jgi:hypothetical protein
MSEGLNPAEKFIYELCVGSFLRLWSHANPQGKEKGKELCDVLVVCPPDVIIFSVKEITLKDSGTPEVDFSRWLKRAVEESVKQIYGAERHILSAEKVIRADGSEGISLPKEPDLRVHRVAVGVGSRGQVPLPFGDFGKGFVHVFEEYAANIVLRELNSVTDFIAYLGAKERFCREIKHLLEVREEDLLAMYLHAGRRFPDTPPDVLHVPDEIWEEITKKPEFVARKAADEISYVWDRLIDSVGEDVLEDNMEPGSSPSETERVLRVMAQEDRFSRRLLGAAFKEFVDESKSTGLARMLKSPSGTVYVFLAMPHGTPREYRKMILANRCFVARHLNPDSPTVIGLATERYQPEGFSLDLAYVHIPEWGEDERLVAEKMQKELGYFVSPMIRSERVDEYPQC